MSAYPCTLYDANAPLLSQNFNPVASNFPQSSSWSWITLIDSGFKGAISVLARYSAGGVDQYTVVVGQLLCTKFRLNERAVNRLRGAIMDLKSMRTIGDMLHFGFGVDSIVRNLAATVEGGILVALSAAMIEAFDPDHAATTFYEMIKTFSPPEQSTPSPMQWKALMKACAGTLTETEFPKLAEHLMQLHSTSNQLSVGRLSRDTRPNHRGVSSSDTLAKALLAIGKVSTGDELQITIVGGADAGWLAAVAQHIFDLRIAIFDSAGELLHATSADQRPQVQVHFVKPSDDLETKAVAIGGQVYQLRDVTELFSFSENELGSSLVCSRVPWATALSLTFGKDFKCLLELARSAGSAMAAAGSILKSIAASEALVALGERRHCKTYFKDSLGPSFCRFAVSLLPELAPLMSAAEESKFSSAQEALKEYESCMARIKDRCSCEICNTGLEQGMFEERFCLVLLFETIVAIVRLMAGISAPDTLLPMRSGIETLYRRQLNLHQSEQVQSRIQTYGPLGAILEFNITEFQSELNIEESVLIPRLINAAQLFTGREIRSSVAEQVAISQNGVVVFLNSLLAGGLPIDPESAGRCTVITGHIEMHGRSYTQLEDLSEFDLHGMDYRTRLTSNTPLDPLLSPSNLSDDFDRISLVAQEGPSTVKVGLSISQQHSDPRTARSVIIGPASLSSSILEATGIVYCDGKTCQRDTAQTNTATLEGGDVQLLDVQGGCNVWLFTGSDFGRFVALMRVRDIQPMFYIIMQHNECLNCCVRAARLSEYENAIIIARKRRLPKKRPLNVLESG